MLFWHILWKDTKMNVLILEDEQYLLDKLASYIRDRFDQVFEATNVTAAKALINTNMVHIAIIDHRLPDGLGIEFIKELKQHHQKVTTALMTAHSELSLAIQSVNTGVDHFLEKPFAKDEFLKTLDILVQTATERLQVQDLVNRFTIQKECQTLLKEKYLLSDREIEIIQELFRSDKNEIIAKELCISAGTVKNHLANIYQKTYVAGKRELKEFVQDYNSKVAK